MHEMTKLSGQKALAQWYELVKETQDNTGVFFDESVENYLILTLSEFTLDLSLLDTPIATEYLNSVQECSTHATQKLRKVGDRCLLIAGLFPGRAKKVISVRYYVDMGQQAYLTVSDRKLLKTDPDLFYNLGLKFMEIKEVLNAMRSLAESRTLN